MLDTRSTEAEALLDEGHDSIDSLPRRLALLANELRNERDDAEMERDSARRIIADRDREIARLRGKLAGAELEIINRVRVIAVLTGETPAPIEYVDPAWLTTLRQAGM